MTDRTLLRNGHISVAVNHLGAELCSLQTSAGRELLWQAGPAWPRHAPILFPVIGRLVDDTLVHNGVRYPMPQHGFARDHDFARIAATPTSAHFRLTDTPHTDRHFPFPFVLDVHYQLDDTALDIVYRLGNPSRHDVLPASIGVHPAFAWPLRDDAAKDSYRLEFGEPEPTPVRRVDQVLLRAEAQPTPVDGSTLHLTPDLFADGAIIFDRLSSTSLHYRSDHGDGVTLSWTGFEQLAIWSPPDGTDLICLEPWFGLPDPLDFAGEYRDKPAHVHLAPGEEREFRLRIAATSPTGQRRTTQSAPHPALAQTEGP
ncbi:aldose 1-epimerase family protein (plasmid) [Rhodococcus opacus]|uniref:aldose 1-epimerase family protein n=1 Tax=Rhodococcus opacus TaxID=37919 RepID=UPI0034D1DD59